MQKQHQGLNAKHRKAFLVRGQDKNKLMPMAKALRFIRRCLAKKSLRALAPSLLGANGKMACPNIAKPYTLDKAFDQKEKSLQPKLLEQEKYVKSDSKGIFLGLLSKMHL